MNSNDITHLRLVSQQIAKSYFKSPKEIVSRMGAMQAQDFNMAKLAVGLRLKDAVEKDIDAAINSGDILRTHLLRPTWHFVSADDVYWMTALTAPRIKSSMKGRNRQLELTDKILNKSFAVIEKVLRDGNHLTRKELVTELNKASIRTNENRSSHILFHAELEGIISSGNMKGKQTTYALLNERIKRPVAIQKEEALYKLARTYFESRCPATLEDFVWWSGLSVTEAKLAMQLIKDNFISEKINSAEYWFPASFTTPKKFDSSLFLLPAFDEFLISYKDRSAAIIMKYQKKAFSNNGIFRPVIVYNGKVEGIWKREIKKDQLTVAVDFFGKTNKTVKALVEKASRKLGSYLNCSTTVV